MLLGKYFPQYYNCKITYPRDFEDETSTTDGLNLYFHKLDWNCLLTNQTLHYVYSRIVNRRQGLNMLKEYIAFRIERMIFTEKGMYYKSKTRINKYSMKMAEDLEDEEFMYPDSYLKSKNNT